MTLRCTDRYTVDKPNTQKTEKNQRGDGLFAP